MKNRVIVALALSVATVGFAQKKELKTLKKALRKDNLAEAKAALPQAEALLSQMDDSQKAEYYFYAAKTLYANGQGSKADIDKAIESLSKANLGDVAELKQKMVNSFVQKGNTQYEAKNYKGASADFEKVYRVSAKDTAFLYNAAISSDIAQDFDRAAELYKELQILGYTGIEDQYFAVNAETGEEEQLPDKNTMDLYVKSGSYVKPQTRKSDSKRPDIIKRIALIYVSKGDQEQAVEAIKEAREQNPTDVDLIITEANLYYQMKDMDRFKTLTEEAIELDPNNSDLFYNLGVVTAEAGDNEKALGYYKKALELKPDYTNAKMNIAALILEKEQALIEEMNNLGTSAADNRRYDELKVERQDIYKEAVPYLESVLESAPNNLAAAKTLMNIYSILGDSKLETIKAKVAELEGK